MAASIALVAVALSTFGLTVTPAGAQPTQPTRAIALLASDSPEEVADVQDKLTASGAFAQVTALPENDCGATTPSLDELKQYAAVYVWTNCRFADEAAVGDVLADYADDGGLVVLATFATGDSSPVGGRFASEGYLPTTNGQEDSGHQTLVADLPDDALLAGVAGFDGGSSSYRASGSTVTPGSTLVAHWSDGSPLVAYRANVVELNFFPPSSDARPDFWKSSTDGTQLMVNALNARATVRRAAPSITSTDTASFAVGDAGSFTVTTSGLPKATITETGTLPAGLQFVDNEDGTATLSGTPDVGTGGSYAITLHAANGTTPDATQTFTLDVTEAPVITSAAAAGLTVGSDSSFTVATTPGYPATTAISATGALPGGVTLSDNGDGTAKLHGIPADGSAGSYPITVKAANGVESRTQTLTLTVSLAMQQVVVTSTPPAPAGVVGQTYAVKTTGGGSGNPVTVSIPASSASVCTADGTSVTFRHPGSCVIDAGQAGDDRYAPASTSQTVAVTRASTSTALTVHPTGLSARVAPTAPGAGAPSGTVSFFVDGKPTGTAPLVDGTATLARRIPAGHSRSVAAIYSGDRDFVASSGSTARRDPTITATVSSATARSAYGWYRSAVKVSFHCSANGAALAVPCPSPVTLNYSGPGRSVTRTIIAGDGGAATVTAAGINIDRYAPRVAVAGVTDHATYAGQSPKARCVSSDALSGVAHCTLTRRAAGEATTVTATATDRAGNVSTTTVHYTVRRFYLAGVAYRDGAYQVKEGRTYLVVALTTGTVRPRYYNAAPHGRNTAASVRYLRRSGQQAGLHRYTLLVRIDRGLGRYRSWDMGVKSAGKLHRIVFQPHK